MNKNQTLILNEISNNEENITETLRKISKNTNIPISTLKLNSQILKDLDLIEFGSSSKFQLAKLTDFGNDVLKIIGDDENE